MTEELCRNIERETTIPNPGNRAERFDRACPDCLCEAFSFGNGSPGAVRPEEHVIRFHFASEDFLPDGGLSPLAVTSVQSVGLSLTRDGALDVIMEQAIAELLQGGKAERGWVAVSIAKVKAIRSLLRSSDEEPVQRAFCVYDTARANNPMHAEIMQTSPGRPKSRSRELRRELARLFVRIDRSDFRDGRLNPRRQTT